MDCCCYRHGIEQIKPLAKIVPRSVSHALNLFRVGKKSIFADFRSQQGNVRIFENPRKFDPVYLQQF
jgi:hypothetical protein